MVKKTKPKKKAQAPNAVALQRANVFKLSSCATDYLKALVDPFNPDTPVACIPDQIDDPSYKTKTLLRGTFVTGVAGAIGFVVATPNGMCLIDNNAVVTSAAAFAFLSIPTTDTAANVTQETNPQAPYDTAQLGIGPGGIQYRPVALGLRVRYLGTELNRGGRIVYARAPHVPLAGQSVSFVLSRNMNFSVPVDRKWHSIMYMPFNSASYQYLSTNTAGVVTDPSSIGFICDGCVANSPFEFEVVSYAEYAGVTLNVTPSHSDINGISAVRNFTEMASNRPMIEGSYLSSARKYLSSMTPDDISGWVTTASRFGAAAAGAYTGNPQMLLTNFAHNGL
jgi:hypothetical protein